MGLVLRIHRAERADRLVEELAAVLGAPLDDPFMADVVSVPTRGVERWLTQRLSLFLGTSTTTGRATSDPSRGVAPVATEVDEVGGSSATRRHDGVCANIDFPFPGRLVGDAVASVSGIPRGVDPWRPERSVWPLLEVVEANLDEPWMASLGGHLRGRRPEHDIDNHPTRQFAVVRHLADLFDRYGVHRPGMILRWAEGDDMGDEGTALPHDLAWQAELWRRLRERVAEPSPAERLSEACAALRDGRRLELPSRVSLFGLTRLPASYVDVLRSMAVERDVHLFLLHPSPVLWARIADRSDVLTGAVRRSLDPTARLPNNPLLATWGNDAREMQLVLGPVEGDDVEPLAFGEGRPADASDGPSTLLHLLQADIRADRAPAGRPVAGDRDQRPVLVPDDRSLQVFSCHGRTRQVEVLRDAIFHLLAEDPTLEPRDIIVMCPDIDAFSPLIHATFGLGAREMEDGEKLFDAGMPELTVRMADRSLRQTNPVLAALSELLSLTSGRCTASQVIDFAGREPVRRRFRFSDDDLARIEEWTAASGVRWGLDAEHRAPYKVTLPANTWRAGLDRLLLGVTMGEQGLRLVGSTLPLDDVDSGDIDLAGRLAELVDRLHASIVELSVPMAIDQWVEVLARAADSLMATTNRDGWQRAQLERILDDVATDASAAGPSPTTLTLADVRALLDDRLRGQPTRANFRTGHLTICTLVPMRSVPHRVVCILGLDDGVFPRRAATDGDDLLQRDPWVGDPDHRSEDRQLLLDALMAADDHLVVTFNGRDERTNAVRPPAVPLGELLDVVDATARLDAGEDADVRDHVVVSHPLQPSDPRNFTVGALVAGRPWSFDPVALDGAKAMSGDRSPVPPFLDGPLPEWSTDLIELDDLVRFVQHPVKAFLRQRLGVVLREHQDDPADGLPVELDSLQQWEIGQRLLHARLAGVDAATCWEAERSRGSLPPGELGLEVLDEVMPGVDRIVEVVADLLGPEASRRSLAVRVDLEDGQSVVGTVPDVVDDSVTSVTFSRLAAKHRLAAWVRFVALSASGDADGIRSVAIGKGPHRRVAVAVIEPMSADIARGHLDILVDLYRRGMREPAPLYGKTSSAWASARRAGEEPTVEARWAWQTSPNDNWDKEDRELVHQLVLDGATSFDQLIAARPRPDERGATWPGDETTRLGRYARRLWDGLLDHETVSNR